LADLNKYQRK